MEYAAKRGVRGEALQRWLRVLGNDLGGHGSLTDVDLECFFDFPGSLTGAGFGIPDRR